MPEENPDQLPDQEPERPPELPEEEPQQPPELEAEEPVAPPELEQPEEPLPPELPDMPGDADIPAMPMPAEPFYPGGSLDERSVIGDAGLEAHGDASGTAVGGVEEPDEAVLLGGDASGFWAKITGNSIGNGTGTAHITDPTTKWTYSFEEVYKATAGFGGWATLSGGRSGTDTARNSIDDINTTTGADRMGTGLKLSNMDVDDDSNYELALRPVPDNVIVWMRDVTIASSVEYWFNYETSADFRI